MVIRELLRLSKDLGLLKKLTWKKSCEKGFTWRVREIVFISNVYGVPDI